MAVPDATGTSSCIGSGCPVQRYRNTGGDSGVVAYESGPDFIRVRFRGGRTYRYSHKSAGALHVQRMQELAAIGHWLSTYISQNVHDCYETKE